MLWTDYGILSVGMDAPLEIRGFLIDMDGLLLDTERVAWECWRQTEEETGHFMPDNFYYTLIGQSMKRIEARLHEVMNPACDIREFLEIASRIYIDRVVNMIAPVKPLAREFLEFLDMNGVPRCLATSTGKELCQHKLKGCGLLDLLPLRVCGDEVNDSKPAPDIYLAAASRIGIQPHELLVLEDSENGLRAGMEAGCLTAHIPDVGPVAMEVQAKADRIYRDLGGVIASLGRDEIVVVD